MKPKLFFSFPFWAKLPAESFLLLSEDSFPLKFLWKLIWNKNFCQLFTFKITKKLKFISVFIFTLSPSLTYEKFHQTTLNDLFHRKKPVNLFSSSSSCASFWCKFEWKSWWIKSLEGKCSVLVSRKVLIHIWRMCGMLNECRWRSTVRFARSWLKFWHDRCIS